MANLAGCLNREKLKNLTEITELGTDDTIFILNDSTGDGRLKSKTTLESKLELIDIQSEKTDSFSVTAIKSITLVPFTLQSTNKSVTLPDATTITNKIIGIIVSGTNTGALIPITQNLQTIEGEEASAYTFTRAGVLLLVSDGLNYRVILEKGVFNNLSGTIDIRDIADKSNTYFVDDNTLKDALETIDTTLKSIGGGPSSIVDVVYPPGTIAMWTKKSGGDDWVDNVTIPGMYACVEGNTVGLPALEDRFIIGKKDPYESGYLNGGSNLFTDMDIPGHTHTINHTHSGISSSGAHTHSIESSGDHTHTVYSYTYTVGGAYRGVNSATSNWTSTEKIGIVPSSPASGAHTHSIESSGAHTHTVPSYTGSSGNWPGSILPTRLNNLLKTYTVLFIGRPYPN